ncbi:MAG: trypsin-like peptidase domain-containing protein [Burkholderiales bacterium]|nr:trypsin-like peptidase domain-containing protein [Burkholderiales bacterium]
MQPPYDGTVSHMLKMLRLALACLLLGGVPALAQLPVVPGEPSLTSKSATPTPILRLAPKAIPGGAKLAPVTDAEVDRLRELNRRAPVARKRLAIGIERPLARSASGAAVDRWIPVTGGFAIQASLTSPGAGAMRMAIDLANVPADVEMVFFGSDAPDRLVGPVRVGDIKDRTAGWWSPLTDGETQTVEFFTRKRAGVVPIRLTRASHVFTTAASGFAKRVQEIGDSGACNVDIKCSSLQGSQAFLNARNAVAQMVFNDGGVYMCTGTLLNDTAAATQIPWFFGANHCFDNDAESAPLKTPSQMQSVANTLNTLWFFEAQACNLRSTPAYVQLTNGAQFLYNNPQADVLFVRLNDAAPAGAFFAAWSANAVGSGASVISVHHPLGDLKKVSEGTVLGTSHPPVSGGSSQPFSEVRWSSGTTEGGSSGAGLFTFDGSQYLLRGGLWGGTALCSNLQGTDNFSRFDIVYSSLAQYLNASSGPAYDFTDLWWNPGESGWGLNLIQHPNGIIFAMWYTYDANRKMTWYHVPSGTWTSSMTYTGTLYAVAGPAFDNPTFSAAQVKRTAVGTATLSFTSATSGTWSFDVDGVRGSKPISRLPF